jgi:phosphorylcholine metabolism protein LicD
MYERSKKIWEMLDMFLSFCEKEKLKYHLAAGSVLAVLRGQDFSWFADVDIAVSSIDLNSRSGELINHFAEYLHYTRYRTNATREENFDRSISQLVFMSSQSDAEIEPAIIDIHSLEFVGSEARMYVGDSDFLSSERKYFSDFRTVKVDGRTLCLPDQAEIYLEQLYGEGWPKPAERFYHSSHRTRRSI